MSQNNRRSNLLRWVLLAVVVVGSGAMVWVQRSASAEVDPSQIYTVQREDMRVSVVDTGQLQAAEAQDVHNEVRGSTTILKLIPEGTMVEAGDLLIELDAAGLEDQLTAQQIRYQKAKADHLQASEAVAIQESLNQSSISQGQLALALAKTDLEKFEQGDKTLQEKDATSQIFLADLERENAKNTYDDTKELVDLDYAAKQELEQNRIDLERRKINLEKAELTDKIMRKFEFHRTRQVLQSDLDEAEAELGRVKRRAVADVAQTVADFNSKTAILDQEKEKMDRLVEAIGNAKVYAKTAGMVTYPVNSRGMGHGGGDNSRIEEGSTVRERQLLLSLPDTSTMKVRVNIHESALNKVKVGMRAMVTLEALPEEAYFGKVIYIAPLPSSPDRYLNPDLKVYPCEVLLGGKTDHLKPGMSANIEIVSQQVEDAIVVPINAVHREGMQHYTYVDLDREVQLRRIEVGVQNESQVVVTDGLSVGDRLYLVVPPGAPAPDFGDEATEEPAKGPTLEELNQRVRHLAATGTVNH